MPSSAVQRLRPATGALASELRPAFEPPPLDLIARLLKLAATPLGLLSGIALLRSPGLLGILNIDESDFTLIGRAIGHGATLYVDIVEIKPPLGCLAFVPAGLLKFGAIQSMHLLGVLWVWATALLVGAAARRLVPRERGRLVAAAGAWLFVIATCCDVPSLSSEVLMNLPLAAALWFVAGGCARGRQADFFGAGLCVGVGVLCRHQALVLLGGVGLGLLWQLVRGSAVRPLARSRTQAFSRGLLLVAGFAIPPLILVGVYAHLGHLPELWDWVVVRNLAYTAPKNPWAWTTRLLVSLGPCVALLWLPWRLAIAETRGATYRRVAHTLLAFALWSTWLAVAVGGRFYEHYFLQFAPLLGVAGASQGAALLERWTSFGARRRMLLTLGAVLPPIAILIYCLSRASVGGFPGQDRKATAIATWLDAHTRLDETVFVWGHFSPIYVLADRTPGTRYVYASLLVGNFDPGHLTPDIDLRQYVSDRDVAATIADLDRNRVPIFVDTAPSGLHSWDKVPLSLVPALENYVKTHYEEVGEAAGARIYRRREVH